MIIMDPPRRCTLSWALFTRLFDEGLLPVDEEHLPPSMVLSITDKPVPIGTLYESPQSWRAPALVVREPSSDLPIQWLTQPIPLWMLDLRQIRESLFLGPSPSAVVIIQWQNESGGASS